MKYCSIDGFKVYNSVDKTLSKWLSSVWTLCEKERKSFPLNAQGLIDKKKKSRISLETENME